jgi:hypothetical protein
MGEEKIFTPEQSLAVIQRMMDHARSRFEENGMQYLVWGGLNTFAGIGHYLLGQAGLYALIFIPYLVLVVVGMTYNIVSRRRGTKASPGNNPIGKLISSLWVVLVVNINVMGFFMFGALGSNLTPVIMLLLGIGVCISGLAVRSKMLMWAGILVNAIGMITFYVDLDYQPLMLSLAAFSAMVIPGAILYFRR